MKPLKIVVHAGNGGAGLIVDRLEPYLPFEFIKVDHEPDGTFPNGVPNPMLIENHRAPVEALRRHGADLAISWDGDYDRCFLFDEHGGFIEGYYIVGLLASVFLARDPGGRVVHDPRLTWNTLDIVAAAGGKAVQSKSGHAFMKQVMRDVDGVYGGEMSAHHYFREFAYCDSGMIPWLVVTQVMSDTGKTLSQLVGERMRLFPASGEINRRVPDVPGDDRRGAGEVPADGAVGGPHRRRQRRVRPLALQPARLEYRAADPAQCREPRRRGADAREDRRAARADRRRPRLGDTVGVSPLFIVRN